MKRQVKSHVFRGRRYQIKKVPHSKLQDAESKRKKEEVLGICKDTYGKAKKILISSSLKELAELECLIHEGNHAIFNDLDEEAIRDGSRDMAKFLWRLGYRKVENVDK